MDKLNKLLEKLGLKFEDLTAAERKVYEQWANVLSTPAVTIEQLKTFLTAQIEALEAQQNDYRNSQQKDLFLKACLRNAKMIRAFILGPEQRKQWVDQHLAQRIKQ